MVIRKWEKFILCVRWNNCVKVGLIHSATCGCSSKCMLASKLLQCHKYGLSSQSLPSVRWFSPLFTMARLSPCYCTFTMLFLWSFPCSSLLLQIAPAMFSLLTVSSLLLSLFALDSSRCLCLFSLSYSSKKRKTLPTNNGVVMLADSLLHTLPLDYLLNEFDDVPTLPSLHSL